MPATDQSPDRLVLTKDPTTHKFSNAEILKPDGTSEALFEKDGQLKASQAQILPKILRHCSEKIHEIQGGKAPVHHDATKDVLRHHDLTPTEHKSGGREAG